MARYQEYKEVQKGNAFSFEEVVNREATDEDLYLFLKRGGRLRNRQDDISFRLDEEGKDGYTQKFLSFNIYELGFK